MIVKIKVGIRRRSLFSYKFRANRAPAKHVALWEEEERRQP